MIRTNNIDCISYETTYFGDEFTYYPTVIESPQGAILVDLGGPDDVDRLEASLDEAGYEYSDICKIIVTHHDLDHGGCLSAVLERTNAEVLAHRKAVPYLNGKLPSIKRRDYQIHGVDVDFELCGGERIRTNEGPMDVIFAPGHNPDHLVFYLEEAKILIASDQFAISDDPSLSPASEGSLVGPKSEPSIDIVEAFESMEPLLDLEIEQILCFHGGVADAGTEEIRSIYQQGPEL